MLQCNTLTTEQYALIFCAFSYPYMVKGCNGGIIKGYICFLGELILFIRLGNVCILLVKDTHIERLGIE